MTPTIGVREVAEHARVSVGTVSNVLNNPERVSPPTLDRVQRAIRELGFVRNDAARQLRRGHSGTIGMIMLDGRNPYFTDIARGASQAASAAGLSLTLGDANEDWRQELEYLELFDAQRVRGVLLFPQGDVDEAVRGLRRRGIPSVLLGKPRFATSASSVIVDDVAGGALATHHLLGLGHRRILFAGGTESIPQVVDRITGAARAVAEVVGAQLEVVSSTSLSVEEGRSIAAMIARRPAPERPHAVFAANDLVAIGLTQALLAQSPPVRIPHDIAVVGYDDIDFAASAAVPLTSVRQPSAHLGATAVDIILNEVRDPALAHVNLTFPPELVVRESAPS